jgi:uncharacterized protein YjiS (DUF1127 family)
MSLTETLALSSRPLPPLSRLLVKLALTVATWELRHRTRKQLTDMPVYLLRDIGIDEMEAAFEVEKPFWRG